MAKIQYGVKPDIFKYADAWESTNCEGLCDTPWYMVTPELNVTKKVTTDSEGSGPHCQRLWLKEHQRMNPEDSTFCLRTLEAPEDVRRMHRMAQ